jgi:2-dehydropantoate 2-reductase
VSGAHRGTSPRFLVVGAGGIGGIVAAHLIEQGHDVTTLTTNPVIADAINASGFRVRGEASPGDIRGRALLELPKDAPAFDYVLLATQPPQVEAAARGVLSRLADDGHMVCFQNGLIEERIAKICGKERVIGAVVAWGASMVEPGVYDRTSAGGFQIGHLDADSTAPAPGDAGGPKATAVQTLASALECIGPTVITQNLLGSRWSKLAINCAISSLGTVGGDRLGVLMRQRHVRRLALEIMTEVTEVAKASGIRLEKVAGTLDLEWISLTDADKQSAGSASLIAKHALLLAVGARYRRLRSSMLAAIERGRTPSVEFLNGDIVTRGKALGIPTPINGAIRDEILKIAGGKAKSSHELLRSFFDRTRSLVSSSEPASVRPAPPSKTVEAEPLPAAMKSEPPAPASVAAPSAGASPPADTIVDPKPE